MRWSPNFGQCVKVCLARQTNDPKIFKEAFEKYHTATQQQDIFPEAYYNWGANALLLRQIADDGGLEHDVLQYLLTSGFQFIIDGRPEAPPFTLALQIESIDQFHNILCQLILLSFQVIQGKRIEEDAISSLKEIAGAETNLPELKNLVLTLLNENDEKQALTEEDDLLAASLKILINRIIESQGDIGS